MSCLRHKLPYYMVGCAPELEQVLRGGYLKLIKHEHAKEEASTVVNAQASLDVASSISSDLAAKPAANVAPKPNRSPRLSRGKPKVYNIRHTVGPPRRSRRFKWRLLKRAHAHEDIQRLNDLKYVASQVIQSRKLYMSPLYLLDLLTKRCHDLPRTTFHALHNRVSRSFLQRVRIPIPL